MATEFTLRLGAQYCYFDGLDALQKAESFVQKFEVETNCQYVKVKSDRFKTLPRVELPVKVFWEENSSKSLPIPYDGVPFVIVGRQVRECCHGPDRHRSRFGMAKLTEHAYSNNIKTEVKSKKMNCPAAVYLRYIIRFPDYKIHCNSSYQRKKQGQQLKRDVEENLVANLLHRVYVSCPLDESHRFHLMGEIDAMSFKLDKAVVGKIHSLVSEGVRNVSEMSTHIEMFSEANFPSASHRNNRYYPSERDIRNHMYRALSVEKSVQSNAKGHDCKYTADLPHFLRYKSKMFIDHCMKRLPTSDPTLSVILPTGPKTFHVTSHDSGRQYDVDLGSALPCCSCEDWLKTHLPCKHMLYIILHVPGQEWNTLSDEFTGSPQFCIDEDIFSSNNSQNPTFSNETESEPVMTTTKLGDVNKNASKSKFKTVKHKTINIESKCKMLSSNINNYMYHLKNTTDYEDVYKDLMNLHEKLLSKIPSKSRSLLRKPTSGQRPQTYQHRQLKLQKTRRNKAVIRKKIEPGPPTKKPTVGRNMVVPMDTSTTIALDDEPDGLVGDGAYEQDPTDVIYTRDSAPKQNPGGSNSTDRDSAPQQSPTGFTGNSPFAESGIITTALDGILRKIPTRRCLVA